MAHNFPKSQYNITAKILPQQLHWNCFRANQLEYCLLFKKYTDVMMVNETTTSLEPLNLICFVCYNDYKDFTESSPKVFQNNLVIILPSGNPPRAKGPDRRLLGECTGERFPIITLTGYRGDGRAHAVSGATGGARGGGRTSHRRPRPPDRRSVPKEGYAIPFLCFFPPELSKDFCLQFNSCFCFTFLMFIWQFYC